MNLDYVDIKQEDLPNIFSMVRVDNPPHFSIPVFRIIEAATLPHNTDILPPYSAVQVSNNEWRVVDGNCNEVVVFGYKTPIPNYILTEDVAKAIAEKFNRKWVVINNGDCV